VKQRDLSLATPQENLACDEVLLEASEAGQLEGLLRFWEPAQHFVVLGYANHAALEANLEFCRGAGIPVLRRCSGGGAVLQGPGCLNYSLILPISSSPRLAGIAGTNDYVLERNQRALESLLKGPVERQGHTDLTSRGRKFSGNSQRRRKDYVLFHGSFLLDADIGLIARALPFPSHQPEYRRHRPHADFLMNLQVPVQRLKEALLEAWEATDLLRDIPLDAIAQLAGQKYSQASWNLKF
jgi:lipoate---protein ligase